MKKTFALSLMLIVIISVNAQISSKKYIRSSITMPAFNKEGIYNLNPVPDGKGISLPQAELKIDRTNPVTWVTNINEPILVQITQRKFPEITIYHKVFLFPGDSLSLNYKKIYPDSINSFLVPDIKRSKIGAVNSAMLYYQHHADNLCQKTIGDIENGTATGTSIEFAINSLEDIYTDAQKICGNNIYLKIIHDSNINDLTHWFIGIYESKNNDKKLPASLTNKITLEKLIKLYNDPLFYRYTLSETIQSMDFFTDYDLRLKQKYQEEMKNMNDSSTIAFIGQKILTLNAYTPFRDVLYTNYLKNTYLTFITRNYTNKDLATARQLLKKAMEPLKDSITLIDLQHKIEGLENILPNSQGTEFALEDHNGKIWHFSDMKGKVVFIDIWTTWCGPCRYEAPYFEKLAEAYKSKDVIFIGISADSPDAKAKWVEMAGHKQTLQLYSGAKSALMKYYQISGYPTFILFDKNGRLVTNNAPRPSEEKELRQAIDKLL